MNNDYRVWQDFNNISVEVKIDNIKYNSILYVEKIFFNDKIFNVNFISNNVQIIPFCKEHKYNKDKLKFKVLSSIEENEDEGFVSLNKEIVVDLKSNKKVHFDDEMKKNSI